MEQQEWDLASIKEIVGDYQNTLADCEKLLEENPGFGSNRGAFYNLEWNILLQPKVDYLQKRLSAHNQKIQLLLEPLELSLLSEIQRDVSDIHQDLADRITAVHHSVLHLQGCIISDAAEAMSEQLQPMQIPLEVPAFIEAKFLAAAVKVRPEVRRPKRFPLQLGADSFLAHFWKSTKCFQAGRFLSDRTPPPEQYLNLLKCVWILLRIEDSEAFEEVSQPSSASQWPGYIKKLRENLSKECQRFLAPQAERLMRPDMTVTFGESEYNIWIEEDLRSLFSPRIEKILPAILAMEMPSPSESLKRQMTVHPISQFQYKLIEAIQDTSSQAKQTQPVEIDIDLKSFSFVPLYATPSSRPTALKIMFDSGSKRITPEFVEIKHIYHLQNILTGYQVFHRYDQKMVKVQFAVSDQPEDIEEHGRLQLWLPRQFTDTSPSNSAAASTSSVKGDIARASNASGSRPMHQSATLVQGTRTPSRQPTGVPSYGAQTSAHNRESQPQVSVASTPSSIKRSGMRLPSLESLGSFTKAVSRSATSPTRAMSPRQRGLSSSTISSARSATTKSTSTSLTSRSSAATVTTIETSNSTRARVHSKPLKPMLVIYLKSKHPEARLSLVALELDFDTMVNRERCNCRSSNTQCRTSCIERTQGHLLAQRWDTDGSLASWDLAKLGVEQRKEGENRWKNVKRVTFKFETWEGENPFPTPLGNSVANLL